MAGIFGALISGVQTLLLERQTLADVEWTQSVVLFTCGYALRWVVVGSAFFRAPWCLICNTLFEVYFMYKCLAYRVMDG